MTASQTSQLLQQPLLWWKPFLFHLQWLLCCRIGYIHFVPLFLSLIFQLIKGSLFFDEEAIIKMLNAEARHLLTSIVCMAAVVLSRCTLTSVEQYQERWIPTNLFSVVLTCWCMFATASSAVNMGGSNFCVLLVFVSSCLIQWRFICQRHNVIDFSNDVPSPALRLSSFLKEGFVQTLLSLFMTTIAFTFLYISSTIILLFLRASVADSISNFAESIRFFLVFPSHLWLFYSSEYHTGWIGMPLLILAMIWTTSMLELTSHLIQLAKDDMSEEIVLSLTKFPSVGEMNQENECLIAHAMYVAIKDAPLAYDPLPHKWIVKPAAQQFSTTMKSSTVYPTAYASTQGFTWLEKLWFWEERKRSEESSVILSSFTDLLRSPLVSTMLQQENKSELWHSYMEAASAKFAEFNNILLSYIQTYDSKRKVILTHKRYSRGIEAAEMIPPKSLFSYKAKESNRLDATVFNQLECGNLTLCILYLKGITQWLCIANACSQYNEVIQRSLRDTIIHARRLNVIYSLGARVAITNLCRFNRLYAMSRVGAFLCHINTLLTLCDGSLLPHVVNKLETLESVANDSLKKLKVYKNEVLLFQNDYNSQIQQVFSDVYDF